ncbi:FliM/FliN family flagellar motor switch protein [Candidatus Latescibacterota bacterium]
MAKSTPKKTPAKKAKATPAPKVAPPRDNIDRLESLPLTLTTEIGRTRATIEKVHEWGDQSLVELDKTVGEPVDILLNGELFARGEVVTVDENFGVRITEIVEPPA